MSEPLVEYEEAEVVEGLPVLADVREVERSRAQSAVARAQTAAVAATGFVAGAATAAVLGRTLQRQLSRSSARRAIAAPEPLELLSTRTYLVTVHLLGRRQEP
ncbi:MAG: hypothetical protein NVSMB51_19170 [Solirubrobacteraceae bacterium]